MVISLLVFLNGIFAFTALSDFMYKNKNIKYEIKPIKEPASTPTRGEKQVFNTKKNKNPNKQSSIKRDR